MVRNYLKTAAYGLNGELSAYVSVIKIANAIGCSVGELYDDFNEEKDKNTITCPKCGAKFELKEE